MSIHYITKHNGGICDFCGECSGELKDTYKDIIQILCHNCLFGTNKNIVLPINISDHFNEACNDCEYSSAYKLTDKNKTIYYCNYHMGGASIYVK